MRNSLYILLVFAVNVVSTQAQEEYAYKVVTSQKGDTLRWESPVSTASTLSKTETLYVIDKDIRLCAGELITGVTFKGYNPGEEKTRHLTMWINNEQEMRISNFNSTDKMIKVYDGDCKILHGGTADQPEDILHIAFSTPVAYAIPNIRMTIISEGEASSDSVMFLHSRGYLAESLCALADKNGQLGNAFKSNQPCATFTIATPVKYVSGTVTDEDGTYASQMDRIKRLKSR